MGLHTIAPGRAPEKQRVTGIRLSGSQLMIKGVVLLCVGLAYDFFRFVRRPLFVKQKYRNEGHIIPKSPKAV